MVLTAAFPWVLFSQVVKSHGAGPAAVLWEEAWDYLLTSAAQCLGKSNSAGGPAAWEEAQYCGGLAAVLEGPPSQLGSGQSLWPDGSTLWVTSGLWVICVYTLAVQDRQDHWKLGI